MAIVLGFNLLLIAVCGYAFWRGGGPERVVGIACLVASAATQLIHMPRELYFRNLETEILIVDAALLVILLAVALKANRYWPIWATAAHATAVAVHLARAFNPLMDWPVYALAATASSVAVLGMLGWGSARHRKRLRLHGSDRPWRTSSGP